MTGNRPDRQSNARRVPCTRSLVRRAALGARAHLKIGRARADGGGGGGGEGARAAERRAAGAPRGARRAGGWGWLEGWRAMGASSLPAGVRVRAAACGRRRLRRCAAAPSAAAAAVVRGGGGAALGARRCSRERRRGGGAGERSRSCRCGWRLRSLRAAPLGQKWRAAPSSASATSFHRRTTVDQGAGQAADRARWRVHHRRLISFIARAGHPYEQVAVESQSPGLRHHLRRYPAVDRLADAHFVPLGGGTSRPACGASVNRPGADATGRQAWVRGHRRRHAGLLRVRAMHFTRTAARISRASPVKAYKRMASSGRCPGAARAQIACLRGRTLDRPLAGDEPTDALVQRSSTLRARRAAVPAAPVRSGAGRVVRRNVQRRSDRWLRATGSFCAPRTAPPTVSCISSNWVACGRCASPCSRCARETRCTSTSSIRRPAAHWTRVSTYRQNWEYVVESHAQLCVCARLEQQV